MVMALSVAEITAFLQSKYVRVLDEWTVECLEWLQEEYRGQNVKPEEMKQYVYEQWLDSDLGEIAMPALPAGIAQQRKTLLTGRYALQVNSVQDVSVPAYGQLLKLQGRENENALVSAATQSNQPSQNKFEPKSSRMLMLQLTDGHQFIQGMEYQPISHLNVDILPGTKVLVTGSVQCRLGVLLLTANNVRILGGEVESLAQTNSKIHILTRALGINETREIGEEQHQIPSNDRRVTSGDPSNSVETNGVDHRGEMTNHAQTYGEAAFGGEAEFFSDDLGDDLDTLMLNEIEQIEEMDQIQRLASSAEETEWPADDDDSVIEMLVEEVERTHGLGQASNDPGQNPKGKRIETTHGVDQALDVPGQNQNGVHVERNGSAGRVSNVLGQMPNKANIDVSHGINQASNVFGQNGNRVHVEKPPGVRQAKNNPGQNPNMVSADCSKSNSQANDSRSRNPNGERDGLAPHVIQADHVNRQQPNMQHKVCQQNSMSSSSHTIRDLGSVRVKPIVLPPSKTTHQLASLTGDLATSTKPDSASDMEGNRNGSRLNRKGPSKSKAEPQFKCTNDSFSNAGQVNNCQNKIESTRGTPSQSSDRRDTVPSQIENQFHVPSSAKRGAALSETQGLPDAKPKIPTTGLSTFFSDSARQDAALQKLRTESLNPAQAVGVASRITKGDGLTTAFSTSGHGTFPAGDKTAKTLSSEESISVAKRRRLCSGQGSCPPDVDNSSVVKLSSVMSRIWAKDAFTFTIKGFIVTLLSSLNRNNGYWSISAKISDKTASLDVDLSNEVLTGLIGYSVPEMMQMKKTYRTKDATTAKEVETKLRQGLAQCQKSLIEMHCTMTVSVNSDQIRPLVTSVGKTDPADTATNFREVPKKS